MTSKNTPPAVVLPATPQPPTAEPGQPSSAMGVDENDIAAIEWIEAHGADSSDRATLTLYKHRWKEIGKVLRKHGLPFGTLTPAKPPEQGRAADVAVSDAQIIKVAKQTKSAEPGRDGYILPIKFARAILAIQPPASPVAVPEGFGEQALQIVAELVGLIQAHGELTLHNHSGWMDKALRLVLDEQSTQTPLQPLADSTQKGGA